MSLVLGIPVKYVHNGIPLPSLTQIKSNKNGDYLLSINRIIKEKGIDDSIDLAIETRNNIKIVGDDIHLSDPLYVRMIKEKCQNSDGYAEYFGLVNNNTKVELIKNCKAVIACPKPTWIEAFGLYAIEANAYGKPILGLANGGLNDIVVSGVNGFLAKNPEELKNMLIRSINVRQSLAGKELKRSLQTK